jgi:SAM-dependent methyltransferase
MDINQIDWNGIWRDGVLFYIGNTDKTALWDRNAARWNALQHKDDYCEKVMERLKLAPDWTVLDVGCGAGLLSIPLAKQCKHVTALDPSGEMLRHLQKNADKEKLTNITCVHKTIQEAVAGKDIKKHDVVISSRSLGLDQDVRSFLQAMDIVTKRYAYVVWGADERLFDIGMFKAIGRPYGETRTHVVLYNLLDQMGIHANIELFKCQRTAMTYKSLDEAQAEYRNRFLKNQALIPREESRLKKFLKELLKETKYGALKEQTTPFARHALIWWRNDIEARRR